MRREAPLTAGKAAASRDEAMMQGVASGGMMWGMGLFGLVVVVVLALVVAALVKYLFFK